MEIVTRKEEGLFPSPAEISLSCSCPDWAIMCKHVAATLYGVGARLDHQPDVLFTLRNVDPAEMVEAALERPPGGDKSRRRKVLPSDELSSVFGVDIDMSETSKVDLAPPKKSRRVRKTTKKTTTPNARKRKK
jgi:uncharacterized Zn finger protein